TFARVNARIKMVKIHQIFVEKLVNSQLFTTFSAAIRQIFPHFFFRTPLVQRSHDHSFYALFG
ncbi:MAG: hypothetical protein U9R28_03370, partial [Pseudomonadota bacterium]|nr:hypothetical protein [Pseudomonadota bacterium]